MIGSGAFALLLLASSASDGSERTEYAELTIRERVVVRVRTARSPLAPPVIRWKEKRAGRCMATDAIAGAAVTESDSVDFVLKGGARLRARLDSDCPALDYDGGFYLAPTADRKVCADRDSIHVRSGGECQITRFRSLVPDRK